MMADYDETEDIQEEESLVDEISANGHKGYYSPSQSRLAITRDNKGNPEGFNVPRELITGSTEPEDWTLRTRVSEEEIANLVRTSLEMNWATSGHCAEEKQIWLFANLRASLDGESRKEVIEANQVYGQRRMEDHRGALERLARVDANSQPNTPSGR